MGRRLGRLARRALIGPRSWCSTSVEEQRGAEGLVLDGSGYLFLDGQVGEKGFDFRRAHFFGMALVVERDVARDPADVGLLAAVGVVFQAQGVAHLVQKSLGCWLWFHGRFPSFARFRVLVYTAGEVSPNNLQKSIPWRIIQKISRKCNFCGNLDRFRPTGQTTAEDGFCIHSS